MPTYAYACTTCDHRFEVQQSFSDAALTECPQCQGRLRKLFNSVGIVFKGSGFYRTDSRNGAAAKGEASGSSAASSEGAGSKSESTAAGSSSSSSSGAAAASGSSGSSGGSPKSAVPASGSSAA